MTFFVFGTEHVQDGLAGINGDLVGVFISKRTQDVVIDFIAQVLFGLGKVRQKIKLSLYRGIIFLGIGSRGVIGDSALISAVGSSA